MHTLIVTSTRPYSGKSGIAVAMVCMLLDRDLDVGYFKPYGTMPVEVDGVLTDEDALYINRLLTRPSDQADVCPVVRTPGFREDVLAGRMRDLRPSVSDAFARCARGRDVMIVEGPNEPGQGLAVGLSAAELGEMLDGRVLLVDRPRPNDLPDDVLVFAGIIGGRLAGVVLNAVHESRVAQTRELVAPFLESRGVPVFGVIPERESLGSITVGEIVEALGGVVLSAEDRMEAVVESFMVGAMGQDKALRFFRRKARKAVITGGDRADVQLAALETSTTCIVLTGNQPPSPIVLARAQELGVPMIMVDMDTLSAVERMDALLGRVHLHDASKAARIRAMFEKEVDTARLLAAVGL